VPVYIQNLLANINKAQAQILKAIEDYREVYIEEQRQQLKSKRSGRFSKKTAKSLISSDASSNNDITSSLVISTIVTTNILDTATITGSTSTILPTISSSEYDLSSFSNVNDDNFSVYYL